MEKWMNGVKIWMNLRVEAFLLHLATNLSPASPSFAEIFSNSNTISFFAFVHRDHQLHPVRVEDDDTEFDFGEDAHPHHQRHLDSMEDDDTKFDFGDEEDDDNGALVASEGKELERAWTSTTQEVQKQMQLLASYGTMAAGGMADAAMVPRTNALLQDHMTKLRALIVRYEMVAQQYPTEEGVQAGMRTVQEWKDQIQALRMSSRNANLQAKKNIDQAVLSEREQLLSGGQDVDLRRRQLQTQAGMASSAEGITDGLRRTRQMMMQEVERNAATLSVLDQSNATLRKADAEYKGQRSILGVTRSKITLLTRQDLIDRALVIFFVFIFLSVCFYITLRRLPVVKHYVRGSPGLPVHQPPPKIYPPPSYSQSPSQDSLSRGGGHKPDLYESVPNPHDHQNVQSQLPAAPEFVLHTDARAYDPRYHEEL